MSLQLARQLYPGLRAVMANPSVRRFAARRIQAAFRGFRARRQIANRGRYVRRRMGPTPSPIRRLRMFSGRANPARRVQQPNRDLTTDDPFVERTLYVRQMCAIPQGTGIENRSRDALFFSGSKICMNVINATDVGCVYFNYAVIRQKSDSYPMQDAWFRSNGAERSLDFTEPTLSANDYHCRPLNPDNKYIVCHGRWKLAPEATGNWGALRPSMNLDKWIAIKKPLFYEPKDGGEKCTTPYYFCFWFALEGGGTNSDHTNIDAANVDLRIISYFRNPPS